MQFSPTQQQALAWFAITLVLALVLWLLGPVLMPFVVASVLAYALDPVVTRLQLLTRGRMPRVVAVLLVQVVFVVLVLALVMLLVPILMHEVPRMRDQLPLIAERVQAALSPWLERLGIQTTWDVPSFKAFLLSTFSTSWEDGFAQALTSLRIGGSVKSTDSTHSHNQTQERTDRTTHIKLLLFQLLYYESDEVVESFFKTALTEADTSSDVGSECIEDTGSEGTILGLHVQGACKEVGSGWGLVLNNLQDTGFKHLSLLINL